MLPPGLRFVISPSAGLTALAFVLGGVALGTLSGLTPGLHVNALALGLAAVAPSVPGPPHLVGAAMLAAGVVHSFLDVVPALALGVPDAAMAAGALPGHRLVIAGRGREAVRLSALGSGGAVLCAVPLAVPVTLAMQRAYPTVRAHLPVVLGLVVAFLVVTERSTRARLGGVLAFVASGALGLVALGLDPTGPVAAGDVLGPLFAGLFGVPVLLDALDGGGVPPQDDPRVAAPRRTVGLAVLAGAVAGALVGYIPGVSSAIAAVVALAALPADAGDRGFVVATSGVNTANTIFALFALVALGTPRTGVMVAFENASVPLDLPLLLASAALASAVGFVLVLAVGDRYLRAAGAVDYRALSLGVMVMLAVLAGLFAGVVGVVVFGAAAAVGMIPVRFGARRVHLMGVLILPIVVGV